MLNYGLSRGDISSSYVLERGVYRTLTNANFAMGWVVHLPYGANKK